MEKDEKEITNNPFKGLESDQQPPTKIKDKVMASVNFSNMLIDITELFTGNMAGSLGGLFKLKQDSRKKDKNKDGDQT